VERPAVFSAIDTGGGDSGVRLSKVRGGFDRSRAPNYSPGRNDRAIELYRAALQQAPSGDGYYGLTRALLRTHQSFFGL
jgi:hypothetical protein